MANKINRIQKQKNSPEKNTNESPEKIKKKKIRESEPREPEKEATLATKSPSVSAKSLSVSTKKISSEMAVSASTETQSRSTKSPTSEKFVRNTLEKPLNLLQEEKKQKEKQDDSDSDRQIPVTKKVVAKRGEIIVRPTIRPPSMNNPVEEMANAFKANAKALELIQQQQMDLTDSLERSRVERSKMLVKSNDALNDTFKQLQEIQEQVIDKLEKNKGESNKTVLILSVASVATIVFILLILLLNQKRDLQNQKKELDQTIKDVYSSMTSTKDGEPAPAISVDTTTMQEALAQLKAAYESRARDAQNEILSLKQQITDREQELRQLRAQVTQLQQASPKNTPNTAELDELKVRDEEKQKIIGELAQQIFQMRQELEQMKTTRTSPVKNPEQFPSNTTNNSNNPSNENKEATYLKRLNTLLERNQNTSRYQILKIGSVDRQKIQEFEMTELDAQGRETKKYIAEKCFISLIPDEGKIVFELHEVRIVLITQNNRVIRLSTQNLEFSNLDWKQWWQYNEEIITLK